MRNVILLFLVLFTLSVKSQTTSTNKWQVDSSEVDVNIKLSQDTINYLEDIKVTIKITNKLNKAQEILFNKLAPSQIGPWGTSIIIQNANGEINKPNSPNFYVSTLIFADEKYSTHLSPNGTVSQIFLMKDIAVPKLLSDGHYKIQISYYGILSNKVKLVLKR